jgi:hypothetical protein
MSIIIFIIYSIMSSISSKKRNNPYILITCGPTGSGKSSLIDKSIDYLKLERPLNKNIYIIDNLVEQNPDYKNKSRKILKKYFSKNDYTVIEKKIKKLLDTPINKNSIFKNFTNAYFNTRKFGCKYKSCDKSFDKNIRSTIDKNENFILETTGRSFPTIVGWTNDKYKIFISYSLVEFCTLIERNIKRMIEQIKSFLSKERNNSIAPRLPDIRLQIFGEVVNNILKTLIEIIDKNCKTNKNKFETSTERKFRLIIFDNTVLNNNPIFDSQDKNKNLKKIKKKIIDKYRQKNNCKL